ncbi:RNA polymerase sigma factor [Paludisphaera mucosa]|uniref:Sigma-70 family RNA polymerase sigma factor n=1 Tax=Paludisphaera mucosa TaxID=3030827 RepID=A0ABT6F7R5_9BACT|nr:sigma-70 family RNA polymerase sigma factor [Paludisphaera mucosa]MDG3003445.1 sigma-70 family RNA polymerase sigma factor [Paludisphaera mucosa]
MERPIAVRPRSSTSGAEAGETSLTLLERVKTRDGDAWGRLVGLYTPLLRHWFRRWGVRPEDLDDVAQDVFQAVAVSLEGFRRDREDGSFRGWLHGVARHKVLTLLRRGDARGPGGTDFYERTLLLPAPAVEACDDEERSLIGDLYRDALETVRIEFEERTWHAFWRAAVEGHAPATIADELGVSPAAVRQSKSRVLRRLKEVLGEPAGTPDAADDPRNA